MRVNTTDLQNAFCKYLALVEKEDIVVVKNGKSVAAGRYREPDFSLSMKNQKATNHPEKLATKSTWSWLIHPTKDMN